MKKIIKEIAQRIKNSGGQAYLVGGAVRDSLLGITEIKDLDIEIFGLEPQKLKNILVEYGKVDEVGVSFSILKLNVENDVIDFSLPRKEKKVGVGHRGFEVSADPFMPEIEAAMRRDITINALMQDILTGKIKDFFGGLDDLDKKIVRHVSRETFIEDSLRVLRVCQFAARLNFTIALDTIELCKSINLNDLPADRIKEEIFKLLLRSQNPSIGIKALFATRAASQLFPELVDNVNLKALDRAAKLKNQYRSKFDSNPHIEAQLTLMLSVLFYNLNKTEILNILDRLQLFTIGGIDVRKQLLILCEKRNFIDESLATRAECLMFANTGIDVKLMCLMHSAVFENDKADKFKTIFENFNIKTENGKVIPLLKGQDLLDLGFQSGVEMGLILKDIFKKQLNDEIRAKEEAIRLIWKK